jgi:hypothetical protein
MQTQEIQPSRVRRTVNDLVMAEMFLLQATIESATAIGDGLNELGTEEGRESWEAITGILQRTADEALEPYTTRFQYFRKMINSDD